MISKKKPERKPPKPRKCKACGNEFRPFNSLTKTCSNKCAHAYDKEKKAKEYRAETRKMRRELNAKDRGYQLKQAQKAFNAFIRERDKDLPCISSGRTTGQMQAGHYRSTGSCPELRFNEYNCNKQSMKDNYWLSANIEGYRKGLVVKYGVEVVEWLEGPHEPKNYTLDEIIGIKIKYRAKLKEIKK